MFLIGTKVPIGSVGLVLVSRLALSAAAPQRALVVSVPAWNGLISSWLRFFSVFLLEQWLSVPITAIVGVRMVCASTVSATPHTHFPLVDESSWNAR